MSDPVVNLEAFKSHISHMLEADLIAVDTETTGIDGIVTGVDYLRGISVAYRANGNIIAAYFPFRHEEDNYGTTEKIALVHCLKSRPLIFHNRKFDLHSLHTFGINLDTMENVQYDTTIEFHMWNEELPNKSLDYLGKMFVGEGKNKLGLEAVVSQFGWGNVPAWAMNEYAMQDAIVTLKLHEFVWPKLISEDLDGLWKYEQGLCNILYRMEQDGIRIDPDFIAGKIQEAESRCADIESVLSFNPRSNKQLGEFFIDELHLPVVKYTPGGKPSFDKEAMVEYDELLQDGISDNPLARLVAEYRGWSTFNSLFASPMLSYRDARDFIHTDYRQSGPVTGRLSSSHPNLQQIPRQSEQEWNGNAKSAFLADNDEQELIGYDYSQVEFRLAVSYGGDASLLEIFNDPSRDIFQEIAETTGLHRQTVKHSTYCMLYGGGLEKAAATIAKFEGLSSSDPESAREYYERFKATMPGVMAASRRATNLAESRGFVRLWTGRRRHFKYDYYRAFNSILQGGGAELIKRAQIRLQDIESPDCRMVLQVHDEIVFKITKGMREKYDPLIIEAMTGWPVFDAIPIKFKVEGKVWNGSTDNV